MTGHRGLIARVRHLRAEAMEREAVRDAGFVKEPISDERWDRIEQYTLARAAEQIAHEVANDSTRRPTPPATVGVPGTPSWKAEHTRFAFWTGAIARGWIDPSTGTYVGPPSDVLAKEAA